MAERRARGAERPGGWPCWWLLSSLACFLPGCSSNTPSLPWEQRLEITQKSLAEKKWEPRDFFNNREPALSDYPSEAYCRRLGLAGTFPSPEEATEAGLWAAAALLTHPNYEKLTLEEKKAAIEEALKELLARRAWAVKPFAPRANVPSGKNNGP